MHAIKATLGPLFRGTIFIFSLKYETTTPEKQRWRNRWKWNIIIRHFGLTCFSSNPPHCDENNGSWTDFYFLLLFMLVCVYRIWLLELRQFRFLDFLHGCHTIVGFTRHKHTPHQLLIWLLLEMTRKKIFSTESVVLINIEFVGDSMSLYKKVCSGYWRKWRKAYLSWSTETIFCLRFNAYIS